MFNIPLRARRLTDLDAILARIWHMLERGASQGKDPFHTPVLGTVGADTCSLRIVILRSVVPAQRRLCCHTDIRSAKIADLRRNPRVSWLFYHPGEQIQVRLAGMATLHTSDDSAGQAWTRTGPLSRQLYCGAVPGTPIETPPTGLLGRLRARRLPAADSEAGRRNFAVVGCTIDCIDWLQLHMRGNRRAQFVWDSDTWTARWVAP